MGKCQLLSNIFPKGSSERVLSKVQRKSGFQLIEKFLLCSKVKPEKIVPAWLGWFTATLLPLHLPNISCAHRPTLGLRAFPA